MYISQEEIHNTIIANVHRHKQNKILKLIQFHHVVVRLVGGNKPSEGRVEVFYRNAWGTICDDLWDLNEANVVCRMLGYSGAAGITGGASFGQGQGLIVLDNMECNGTEATLADCGHNGFYDQNCGHHEDAGVICIDQGINIAI